MSCTSFMHWPSIGLSVPNLSLYPSYLSRRSFQFPIALQPITWNLTFVANGSKKGGRASHAGCLLGSPVFNLWGWALPLCSAETLGLPSGLSSPRLAQLAGLAAWRPDTRHADRSGFQHEAVDEFQVFRDWMSE